MTHTKAKLYLAGPGVFRPDAGAFAEGLRALCRRWALEGLWPGDGLDDGEPASAQRIFQVNVALLRSADGVVADIGPFRGPHMDDGTAWEIGFAHALGKPVFAWTSDTGPLAGRIAGAVAADGRLRDAQGFEIEDFAAPVNLMIAETCRLICATPAEAIAAAAQHFRGR